MAKRLCLMAVAAFLLLGATSAFGDAIRRIPGENAIIIIGGRVAAISGKQVTVVDENGTSRILEVSDPKGFKVGDVVDVRDGAIEKKIAGDPRADKAKRLRKPADMTPAK